MSSLSQFVGGVGAPKPTGTIDGASAFRSCVGVTNFPLDIAPVKLVASGACTAATLKTILSLSGKGVLSLLGVESADVTSRTHRIKVTLDGVVVFDGTTAATTSAATAFMVVGSVNYLVSSVGAVVTYEPLAFSTSLLIEYASSLSETNKSYIAYRYYPT